MRVANNQLAADAVADIVKAKRACLLLHARVERHLEKHVPQLLLKEHRVVVVDRLADS